MGTCLLVVGPCTVLYNRLVIFFTGDHAPGRKVKHINQVNKDLTDINENTSLKFLSFYRLESPTDEIFSIKLVFSILPHAD